MLHRHIENALGYYIIPIGTYPSQCVEFFRNPSSNGLNGKAKVMITIMVALTNILKSTNMEFIVLNFPLIIYIIYTKII